MITQLFSRSSLTLATIISLLGLTACAGENPAVSKVSDINLRPQVELVRLAYTLEAEEDGTEAPSLETLDAFYAFLEDTQAGYGDTVVFDVGKGVSETRTDGFARFVRARGLSYGGTAALGSIPDDGNITVYLERYIVIPPECGAWTQEATRDRRNEESAHWACATQRNLALMVASPRDLLEGQRGEGNGNAVLGVQRLNQQNQTAGQGAQQGTPVVNAGSSRGQSSRN